ALEREALLTFRQSLVDEYGILSSWGREDGKRDCCKWRGVRCSNTTGHVKVLNLRTSDYEFARRKFLKGTISPALLKLHDLGHLDLSNIDFGGSPVPEFIGSLSKLRYLNLSCCTRSLKIPQTYRKLSGLEYLNPENSNLFSVGSLEWLSHLSSLRYLDLSCVNLTKSSDCSCALPPINPSFIWHFNLSSSIETLDLFDNNLPYSSVYPWLLNLSRNILHLNLASNSLQGPIPEAFQHMPWEAEILLLRIALFQSRILLHWRLLSSGSQKLAFILLFKWVPPTFGIPKFFGNMCSLNELYLLDNKLSGQLSELIQNLSSGCTVNSLEGLCLYDNDITGPIPDLGGFSSLKELYLGENSLNGTINKSINHLFKLETLSLDGNSFTGMLYLANNPLTLKLSHDWVPPFQLKWLSLASCKMGAHFPKWLRTQSQLILLDISNTRISDTVPDWFWDMSVELFFLNLSNNHIKGKLPDLSFLRSDDIVVDISSIHFRGPIPPLLSNSTFLNLSKNKFSWSITFLSELPDCWLNFDSLFILNLANNSFSGKIPDSIGFLHNIRTLSLNNNRLTGELPSSLKNCSQLRVLDLSYNNLSGKISLGTQLQSFNASVYARNLELCSLPLPNQCPNEESTPCPGRDDDANTPEDEDDQFITLGFYVSLTLGFFVGFWGLCGMLMLSRSWRYGYFNFLTNMRDWLYIVGAVNAAKLQTKFRN
ncbi:hypothetical protein CICLE_v10006997mg, partial [Citrus x clementina]